MTGLLFSSRGTRQAMAVWAQDKLEAAPVNKQCHAEPEASPPLLTNSSSSFIRNMATVQQLVHGPAINATQSIQPQRTMPAMDHVAFPGQVKSEAALAIVDSLQIWEECGNNLKALE